MSATNTSHPPKPGLPPRKPLYLNPMQNLRIDARGDSLVLSREAHAAQRLPIDRIARIITNGSVHWSGTALALCLEAGVVITWLDTRGRAIGHTQPRNNHVEVTTTALETYVELPDWLTRFDNWLACRRLETLTCATVRALHGGIATQPPLDARRFERCKRAYVYKNEHPLVFAPEGEGWCHAWVVARLSAEGLEARYRGYNATVLDLAGALTGLLWAELNFDSGTLPASSIQGATNARLFEAWAHQRENRLTTHIGDLKRHVHRELDAWH